jgi:hypothetical protein
MELLYKLWKQYGRIDEWRTANPWRILCELYAKLIGLLLQHWLMLLFAQAGTNSEASSSWPLSFVITLARSWKPLLAIVRCELPCESLSAEWAPDVA